MMTRDEVEAALARMLNGGPITHMPKRKSDVRLLMALAANSMLPRERYSEPEMNAHMKDWLSGFTSPYGLDHVTLRRYLVDHGFVQRDRSGSYYIVNGTVASSVIEPDATTVHPGDILSRVQAERIARRRSRAGADLSPGNNS